jgi:GAF domain-containing protein
MKNAQARVAEDVGGDAVRLATSELPDTRSEAAIPLRARGNVIGALTVQDSQPQVFDEAALSILQIVADQLAVTIRNTRLFAATEKALEAERRAYGEVSQSAWAEFSRQQQGYICGADQALVPAAGSWRPDMRVAQRSGELVQVDEMTLALPIQARDESIGVVYLRKQSEDGEWDSRELALMSTLVERLGAALESAHLYEDTQRRAARERVVGEVTSRMRETLDMESVMQTAAQEIQKALGLDRLVVRLGKPEEIDGE